MGTAMHGAASVLELWEQSAGLSPVQRALRLAEAAGARRDDLLGRPYGQTVAAVLDLRTAVFGETLDGSANCPVCGGRAEFSIDATWLRNQSGQPLPSRECRSPNPADLLAAAKSCDPGAELRRRCLPGVNADRLADLDDALAAADPLADILVDLMCPDCGAEIRSNLDVAAFTWTELDARARHLLHEIDLLARCYGWTEPQVLALSDQRRAAYLRLATGEPA